MLQWKIVNEELPKNNGSGVSDLCLIYALGSYYEISRYIFPTQQDNTQLLAYITKPPIDLINKVIQKL